MFKILSKRGCYQTSPLFKTILCNLLLFITITFLLLSCSSSKPRILEARLWHVVELDHVAKKLNDSLLVQIHLDDEESIKNIKELALFHEQKSLYWVVDSSGLEKQSVKKQSWTYIRDLELPGFEKIPVGKYELIMETYDGDMQSIPLELPAASMRPLNSESPVSQGQIKAFSSLDSQSFRELVFSDLDGTEIRRFIQKGDVKISEIRNLFSGKSIKMHIQDFYPREGLVVVAGPWEP